MDSPAISRSGRLLKKSAKVKEMEDFDIPEFEANLKPRKKLKLDDSDEFDEKKIAPIKIPKISLNVSPTFVTSPTKRKMSDSPHSLTKMIPFPSPVKSKLDSNRPLFQQDSSPERKQGNFAPYSSTDSSSTSTSSSSSSDESDIDMNVRLKPHTMVSNKQNLVQNIQRLSSPQEKVIVQPYRQQFNSPLTFVDQNNELAMYASDDEENSESNLIIAEESSDSRDHGPKDKKGSVVKRKPAKKPPAAPKPRSPKKKPPPKEAKPPPQRKKPDPSKPKKLTAYMLWCSENRKKFVSQNPMMFSSINKKMGEAWQNLSEKEKMIYRRKAKKQSQKGSSIISTGPPVEPVIHRPPSFMTHIDDLQRSPVDSIRTIGTSPIDVAAYLKLLGESLSIIGQRLTEHEGQIAVSGIFSVLLDSTLCALAPLLCLSSETREMNGCSHATLTKVLDNIAYFMPGL